VKHKSLFFDASQVGAGFERDHQADDHYHGKSKSAPSELSMVIRGRCCTLVSENIASSSKQLKQSFSNVKIWWLDVVGRL